MTTSKTAGKEASQGPSAKPETKDIETAYQIHTLAQIVYARLAATYPWVATPPFNAGYESFAGYPTTPWRPAARMWSHPGGGGAW